MVTGRTIRVPLRRYEARGLTTPLIRAAIALGIRTRPRQFERVQFVLDTASGVTTLSVQRAVALQIPVPRRAVEFTLETAVGMRRQLRHPGTLTVQIPGLEGREFTWPCHFVEHAGPPLTPVLGMAGILNDLRITLDGSYSFEAPYGWLVLEELTR